MICSSCTRSAAIQAGNIGILSKRSVQLGSTTRSLNASRGLIYKWNRVFKTIVRMMVDSSATEKQTAIPDILPEKDDDSGYVSRGWKSEDGKLSVDTQVSGERECLWRISLTLKIPISMGKGSACLEYLTEQEIDEEFELLVLASDGLWDVVPNEGAVSLAQTEEPEAAARKLTEAAFTRGSADNITCIVVKFHHDKAEPADPQHE